MAGPLLALSTHDSDVRVPAAALSHDGFRAWVTSRDLPERVHATFVGGEVLVDVSPESLETHNKVKSAVTIALGGLVVDEDLGEAYSDGALVTHRRARLSTEPDFTFVTWDAIERGRVQMVPKRSGTEDAIEIVGTPDLVVEIISDSSVRKDSKLLRGAYARAGIPEFWLIDARGTEVRFEILRLTRHGYRVQAPASPQRSAVLGRSFALTRSRNRVGTWTYRLTASALGPARGR